MTREYKVVNFWLNLVRIATLAVLVVYAVYIPKDTNDVAWGL